MFRNERPMCKRNNKDRMEERKDYVDEMEDNGTGGKVRVTRYSDGTSTVHWGGPCGSVNYDENGEEC